MSDSHPETPDSEVPEDKAPPLQRRVVRILSSELDVELREGLHAFVREAVGNEVWLETLLPENTLDGEILKTAIEHHWDIALLIVDNIRYPGADRSAAAAIVGATKLLRTLRQTSKTPLLCFYNRIDDEGLSQKLLAAGADGVFRLPCRSIDVVPTMKRCLERFVPKPPEPPPVPAGQALAKPAAVHDDDEEDLEDIPDPILTPSPRRDPLSGKILPQAPPPAPPPAKASPPPAPTKAASTPPPPPPPSKAPPPKPKAPTPRSPQQDDAGPRKPLVKPPWKLDLD